MTKRILVVLLVVGMSLCFIPTAKAYGYAYGEKTNTVDVYVGYFGSTYAYIGTMTEDEMRDNCVYGEWTYSSIDNAPFTRYNLAEGVTMESLLEYLNIATSDIEEIYFLGTDNDYYAGFHNLFGTPHYYFPYLAENWDALNNTVNNYSLVQSYRIEVPAILAFEQSLNRDSGAFDYDKYKAMMDDDECLRIVFGQTVCTEVSTSDSVKWVYKINVQLKGSPITAENMELEYGASAALQYDVDSGFSELDELIRNGLTIWSDNPSIVEVDNDGNLTGHQEGYANIHIEYKDGGEMLEKTVKVTVGPEPEDSDDPYGGGGTGSSKDERDPGTPVEDPEDTENSGNTDQQDSDQKDQDQKDQNQKDQDQKDQDQKNQNQNDQDQKDQDQKNQDQKNQNDNNATYTTDPGNNGGNGTGGDSNGAGGTGDNGVGSGTGGADTGSGSGGGLLSETQGGTQGDDIGGGNPLLDEMGDSSVASAGENAEVTAQTVDDETSKDNASAQTVYLSLGNIAGGETEGGSVSGSGTIGGSGGKMLEIEEQPFYYYVILIVALAALFVGGGMYRSLRFRKDIAR